MSGSMLKKIFGKKSEEGEDGVKPVKANLGEENKFYYNKELKSWVVRGEEHLVEQKQNLPPPPPKRPTTMDSGTRTESVASFSSGSQSTGVRKNLYTSTPGLNVITKNAGEQHAGGIIPKAGFASANVNATLLGSANVPGANSTVASGYSSMRSRSMEPEIRDFGQTENEVESANGFYSSVAGREENDRSRLELSPRGMQDYSAEALEPDQHHFREDQGASVPSTVYTDFTGQSSGSNVSISAVSNRVLPPISSLPNAAISNRDFAGGGAPQKRASVHDSPLSFISTPNGNLNQRDSFRERIDGPEMYPNAYKGREVGEKEAGDQMSMGITIDDASEYQENHQTGEDLHGNEIEERLNSTISNSESDQAEALYTQNDMRQRQRIRPLSQRSAASNNNVSGGAEEKSEGVEPADGRTDIARSRAPGGEDLSGTEGVLPKMESAMLEMISFFGFRYDDKSQRLVDDSELDENKVANGQQCYARRSLSQVCMEIKENKLKQMDYLVGKAYKSLQESSSEYDSLLEMILNIGNITNKTFQEISGTINTVMSNSDEIEKELVKTRGLYLDLVKRYNAVYKQYETDMVNLRSELENEKNVNISNSKEFEEKLQRLQEEFASSEASNNELLHQYYSYIQSLQQQFEEMQESIQSRELKLRMSEGEVPRLKLEIEDLKGKLKERQEEFERESQRLRQSNEELISLSKENEEKARFERMEMAEEYKQEMELMEKFSLEQDEQINQLEKSVDELTQEKTDLLAQLEQLRSETEAINFQLGNLVSEKSRMEEEILSASSQNKEKSSRIAELEEVMREDSRKMEAISREVEELKELKSRAEARTEEVEREKTQLESELRQDKESLAERCESLSRELQEQVLKNQTLENSSREELESKCDEYNKHISWLENEVSRVDEEWRTRQTHLETNYEQLYSQYMALSSREEEFGALHERLKELESEKASKDEQISELMKDKEKISELERRLEEVEVEARDQSEKLRESESEVQRGRRSISELETRLESETGANRALSSELENLKERNGAQLALIQELEQRLEGSNQYKEYMSKLEQRMVELQESLEEKSRSYEELENRHAELLSQRKELEDSSHSEASHQMKLENEKLKETNEAVYIKLEAFSRDIDLLNNQLEWVRRYSPQVYEAMLENTYHYPDNSRNEHEISDIAL